MTVALGRMTWTDLWHAAPRPLVIVPVGSCEQHGPHLPLDTDTRIAMALASRLVDSAEPGQMVIAPPLTISSSGEHAGFPGTLSLGGSVFERLVVELVRSADWSGGTVLVNGHGGNAAAIQRAVSTLTDERRKVFSWWPKVRNGDGHAGETETSLMLAIAPELVRMDLAEAGRPEPLVDLIEALREHGVRAISPNGVLGDPRSATTSHGKALLTRLTIDLVAAVDEWWV